MSSSRRTCATDGEMFFSRWPIFKTFIGLCVAGFAYQLLPSRLGNERLVDDFVEIGGYFFAGDMPQAYAAIREGFAPFLPENGAAPRPRPQQVAAYQQQRPAERQTAGRGGREVRIKAGRNNHFYAEGRVNGGRLHFVIDTGASGVSIRYEDALKAGLKITPSDFTAQTRTANGISSVAPVMIDRIEIEGITVRNVRGSVARPGALPVNLLGMTFLRELSDVRFNGNEILLIE